MASLLPEEGSGVGEGLAHGLQHEPEIALATDRAQLRDCAQCLQLTLSDAMARVEAAIGFEPVPDGIAGMQTVGLHHRPNDRIGEKDQLLSAEIERLGQASD